MISHSLMKCCSVGSENFSTDNDPLGRQSLAVLAVSRCQRTHSLDWDVAVGLTPRSTTDELRTVINCAYYLLIIIVERFHRPSSMDEQGTPPTNEDLLRTNLQEWPRKTLLRTNYPQDTAAKLLQKWLRKWRHKTAVAAKLQKMTFFHLM